MLRLVVALVTLAGVLSCDDDNTARRADVEAFPVVDNDGPAWDVRSAWRLEEDLRIGSVAGSGVEADPAEFAQVVSVAVDSR
ncbi:MAG: hypothetical protein RQ745_11190, partial [Longimicrobiales bacterium]|nr:hypothetical protein [Longimicrobiales bacterium]